jgi:hypothetical protein
MIVILIISEKSLMFMMISVYDSSVDNFTEELNDLVDLCIWWFYSSLKLSTEMINRTIKYTNRQDHSFLLLSYPQKWSTELSNTLECSWRFLYMIVMLIISRKSWMLLTICVYDSSIDSIREKLNVLDDLCTYSQIVKIIQLFSDIMNRTIIYTNLQEHSTLLWCHKYKYHIHKWSRSFISFVKLTI